MAVRKKQDEGCGCLVPLAEVATYLYGSDTFVAAVQRAAGDSVGTDWRGTPGVPPAVAARIVADYQAEQEAAERRRRDAQFDLEERVTARVSAGDQAYADVVNRYIRANPLYTGYGPDGPTGRRLPNQNRPIPGEVREKARDARDAALAEFDRKRGVIA